METASLSHKHQIPPAKQGRGGMSACFGPDAGVLPTAVGFRAHPVAGLASRCFCGSRGGCKNPLPILACSAMFHPKSSAGVRPSLPLAQPALAPLANLIIKAIQRRGSERQPLQRFFSSVILLGH